MKKKNFDSQIKHTFTKEKMGDLSSDFSACTVKKFFKNASKRAQIGKLSPDKKSIIYLSKDDYFKPVPDTDTLAKGKDNSKKKDDPKKIKT